MASVMLTASGTRVGTAAAAPAPRTTSDRMGPQMWAAEDLLRVGMPACPKWFAAARRRALVSLAGRFRAAILSCLEIRARAES